MSNRQSDPFSNLRGSIMRSGAPISATIVALSIVFFIIDFFTHGLLLGDPPIRPGLLSLTVIEHVIVPIWGIVTYALITPGIINVLFACYWMWQMGGSLERSWGRQRFAVSLLAITVIISLSMWLGSALLRTDYILAGLWLPLTALTCAWAAINPTQTMLFNFIIPLQARWVALIMVVIVYFGEFEPQPILGLFSLIAPALAWFYVRGDWAYANRGYAKRGPDLKMVRPKATGLDGSRPAFNPVTWLRDWQERRRLRKLWRDSGFSDRDQRR